jgi:hypothetical protein
MIAMNLNQPDQISETDSDASIVFAGAEADFRDVRKNQQLKYKQNSPVRKRRHLILARKIDLQSTPAVNKETVLDPNDVQINRKNDVLNIFKE